MPKEAQSQQGGPKQDPPAAQQPQKSRPAHAATAAVASLSGTSGMQLYFPMLTPLSGACMRGNRYREQGLYARYLSTRHGPMRTACWRPQTLKQGLLCCHAYAGDCNGCSCMVPASHRVTDDYGECTAGASGGSGEATVTLQHNARMATPATGQCRSSTLCAHPPELFSEPALPCARMTGTAWTWNTGRRVVIA